ncbi:MAG: hypothetical protein JXR49_22400 [Acidobacteria bacterium]|nr:hypothetical protein [Acidobacteriota bacterium]
MNILNMKVRFKLTSGVFLTAGFFVAPCLCQELTPVYEAKIDTLIVSAYRTAAEEFPCKPKTGGKPRMIRWQDVEKCLNDAEERIDWEEITRQIEALREEGGFARADFYEAVESSMSAHAIPYDRVFSVKKKDALLPLSNTVLKFLPDESLIDLPVYSKRLKEKIGTFAGSFTYERSGGLSAANTYRLSMFQYKDLRGDLQTPAIGDRLLLDSFGIPWEEASKQPGFRLTVYKLTTKYFR